MTKHQYRLCRAIIFHKKLSKILKRVKIDDYVTFQEKLDYKLDFSDDKMDSNTLVTLKNDLQEEYEAYHARVIDVWVTRGIALAALVISILALLSEIGILRLPQG